ncbi:MAG: alpha/beta hydrolase [Planctomycetes bacterium]|nr:alpha/beta hydrolase [Planctomycetota bacterium]
MDARGDDLELAASDGFRLAATRFDPVGPRAATVVIAGAAGVPRGYYAPFAGHLAAHGLGAVTLDYRGVGGSRPASLRGFPARLHHWGERDLDGTLGWAAERWADRPLLVVTHSIGGQVLGLAPTLDRVAAVLSVASQSGYWRLWSGARRLQMGAYFHLLIPAAARLAGYLPMRLVGGEDLPRGVAVEWARWCRDPDYVLTHARARGGAGYGRFERPWRAYALADDPYAPRAAVERLLGFYPRAARELRWVEPAEVGRPVGHFGFFRRPFEATLWREAREWLLARAAGGGDRARPTT